MTGPVAPVIRVAELPWPDYEEHVRRDAIVFMAVGSLEQHGLHLPLDTDTRITTALVERVATKLDGIVLPPVVFGARSLARSGGGDRFPGTTNLDGTTLIMLIRDIVREQHRHGVRRLVLLEGHGENDPFVIEGAAIGRRDVGDPSLQVLVIGWWQVVPPEALAPLFPEGFPGWDREHAARIETAMMLALFPELVRTDRIAAVDEIIPPPYAMLPTPAGAVPSQGALADPQGADAAAGASLVDLVTARLEETISAAFARR